MKSIKKLNEYCQLHNLSIRLDRDRNLNGFNRSDYKEDDETYYDPDSLARGNMVKKKLPGLKMHTHRIICEMCGTDTTRGIIVKDNSLRDRYFCSDKCLNKKLAEQTEKNKETPPNFIKEGLLFKGDALSQGLGIILWMMIVLILACLIAAIWLAIAHPDRFLEVMNIWGIIPE